MTSSDPEKSLGNYATFAGTAKQPASSRDMSLGDERTFSGDLEIGETLLDDIEVVDIEARYKIEGMLGQGGMGAVVLATDTRLGRKVAIKRILGEAAGKRAAVQRFLAEAKAIASLSHPNIIQIYDYGKSADGPFLIMEYVDGGSLFDKCKAGPIPLEAVIDLTCHLCDGLAKAHDQKIIHRDIKPANVLLTKEGVPKLTDFGLAKSTAGEHGHTITGAGVVMGTPDFMSPEQRRDSALVDHRSDLWSLAATVYQMVTGRGPKVINLQHVPPQLRSTLGKALEEAQEARYQTVRDFRKALSTSLHVSAASDPLSEEGRCPCCGAENEMTRKFCRKCAASLEVACLECERPMPMWEDVCGDCGARQTSLVDVRRREMAAAQSRAAELLGAFAFAEAASIAAALRDESHPRLAFLKPWAEEFLKELDDTRMQQEQKAAALLGEACKHEAAHDYQSACVALEAVPAVFRGTKLEEGTETIETVLQRVQRKQSEVFRLKAIIGERIRQKRFDGLEQEVNELIALEPGRRDLQQLKSQLAERMRRLTEGRDKTVATAQSAIAARDYENAVRALETIPPSMVNPDVVKLRQHANDLLLQGQRLARQIDEAVRAGHLDGLLPKVVKYLQLRPNDVKVAALRDRLRQQQQREAAVRDEALAAAKASLVSHDYENALRLLAKIPGILGPEGEMVREQAMRSRAQVCRLESIIKKSIATKNVDGLLGVVEQYLELKPDDAEVGSLRQSLVVREKKLAAYIDAHLVHAEQMEKAGQLEKAAASLAMIPTSRRSSRVNACLERVNHRIQTSNQRQLAVVNVFGSVLALLVIVSAIVLLLGAHEWNYGQAFQTLVGACSFALLVALPFLWLFGIIGNSNE